MKSIILALTLIFATTVYAVETKKVCITQTDNKTKVNKQTCKNVKIHKKLELKPIPDKKAK